MTQGRQSIDWEDQRPYHDRPRSWRQWLLARAAREAEWAVPEGPLGDLVRQQRRRASIAQVRTTWVLADALAADKVDFGKDNSPADQAVEIFKAFVSRTEK
jgi:hypothetical protein